MSWSVSEATVTYKGAWRGQGQTLRRRRPRSGSALHCAAQPTSVWITWSLSESHSANPAPGRRRFRPDWGGSTYRQTAWLRLEMLCFLTNWRAVAGLPMLSKSIGAICPTAFAHFVSLCHILEFLKYFKSLNYYCICHGYQWSLLLLIWLTEGSMVFTL